MRIVLMGQGAFCARVLEGLVKKGEEAVGVYTTTDRRGEPIKEAAEKLGVPAFRPASLRQPEIYESYTRLKPDLLVMAFVTDIVPDEFLTYPRLGAIQYHPSLLPRHRGGSSINWAIAQGETKTGLTIFWTEKGIDTGPILLQKEVEISPDDTAGSLYFDKLFPLGVEALLEAVDLIKRGKAPRIPQNESQATYEGLCNEEAATINWRLPARDVYNLIRATDPQPGATTYRHNEKLKLFSAEPVPDMVGKPGEVLEVSKSGIVISALGGAVRVKRVQPEGGAKVGAAEHATAAKLKPGDMMGLWP